MKEHLVNLLLEEYKQECLFNELEKKGVGLADICVNNLDIVLDIIGFPKDEHQLRNERPENVDEEHFSRDWLREKQWETFKLLATEQQICVTDKGLQIESGADKETVEKMLSEYVEWLYIELEKWGRGEYG